MIISLLTRREEAFWNSAKPWNLHSEPFAPRQTWLVTSLESSWIWRRTAAVSGKARGWITVGIRDGRRNSIISDNSECNIKVRPSTGYSWPALTFRNRHAVAMKRVGSTFISLISGIFHFNAPPCVWRRGCWRVPVHTAHTLLYSPACEGFSKLTCSILGAGEGIQRDVPKI